MTLKFCDLKCKHAEWIESGDYSKACRNYVGLYCRKKDEVVEKNIPCIDKEEIR